MFRIPIISVLLLLAGPWAFGQENPLLSAYDLTVLDGSIHVDWTIESGSTCNGQDVERSTDGFEFVSVHRIDGICGDPAIPVSFDWIDRSPPELSRVFYRLKLGFDGYSSVKSVVFNQLISSEQRFFPSPMNGEATLVLNVPRGTVIEIWIWDANGGLVERRAGVSGPVVPISLSGASAGTYSYMATGDDRVFRGRFVKH